MRYSGKVEAVDNCLRRYYDGDLMKEDLDTLFYLIEPYLRHNGPRIGSYHFWDFIYACEDFIKDQSSWNTQALNRTRHQAYGRRWEQFTLYVRD